ncbi:TetR/AcrR family transcriptional regulator [Streptomyces albicerus]|uniref:TetR/AcrR family transcriptional regulator n=1 Tax=Streptomyces albicerus TaxID=2569859 RepID=UPI001CEC3A12|nr:TetR family transcriptional regulator C-terminal domain-containing protein [Streptomyces albicerus]
MPQQTPRRRAARKPPEQRAAEIRATARELALADGLSAMTLRAVAQQAGVTPALVAHYEPSMEALTAETFAVIVREEIADVKAAVAALAAPTERVGYVLHTLLDGSRDEVTAVWVDAWSLGRRMDLLARAVREQTDAWQQLLRDLIVAGRDAGEFVTDDPDSVAWLVLGMIDGLNAHALVHYRDARARGLVMSRAVESELGLPRSALSKPPPSKPPVTP